MFRISLRDYTADVVADIIAARDGDSCIVCGEPMRTTRGVESGNIFKLGTRYSKAVGATYLDANGERQPIVMGSYGIGVGRVLACAAEEHRDENGLTLPISIAPYQAHICRLAGDNTEVARVADDLYDQLQAAGVEVLYDDRGERPGVQFTDADLIGIPVRLTVGQKSLAQGGIEVRLRGSGHSEIVSVAESVGHVQERIAALFAEIAATVVPVDIPKTL